MITIIHGDNSVLSRKQLATELDKATGEGKKIRSFGAADLTMATLTDALQSTSLFGDEQVLVIERLFKMRSKNLRDKILAVLAMQTDQQILLWEDNTVSATNLKLLAAAKPTILPFKTSPLVFQAMDLLGNPREKSKLLTQLHASYKQDTPEFVFSMIARQIRLLINVAEGETAALKPYTLQKARSQGKYFPLNKLLKLHAQLFQIDMNQKLSGSLLSLEQQLDLLALQMAE